MQAPVAMLRAPRQGHLHRPTRAGDRPGVLGGGVPGKEYAAVNWPGGDVARYGGFALGVDRPGYDSRAAMRAALVRARERRMRRLSRVMTQPPAYPKQKSGALALGPT